jgi:type IV secretion system protein VirD4
MAQTRLPLGWPLNPDAKPRRYIYAQKRFQRDRTAKLSLSAAHSYTGDAHLITFAPTGAGKGVSVIIPTLLSYPGSMIVIDPKGENFHVTARYRMSIGQKVHVLDPFGVVTPAEKAGTRFEADSLNPFDFLLAGRQVDDFDSQVIAAGLHTSSHHDPYWDEMASGLLAGLIHLVATAPQFDNKSRNLATVIDLLYHSRFDEYFASLVSRRQKLDRFVRRSLSTYLNTPEGGNRGSVLSMARSYLSILSSATLKRSIMSSTINVSAVAHGVPTTIYIVIPPSHLVSHAALLRMWITVLIRTILRRRRPPEWKTLFLLDECAQLGTLDQLRSAVTLLRGYGLQAWMFFQDLSQLKSLYDDWENIVNNCGVVQSFGVSREIAAKPLSDMFGAVETKDMISIGKYQQTVSIAGRPGEFTELMNYLRDPAFHGRWDPNPYF